MYSVQTNRTRGGKYVTRVRVSNVLYATLAESHEIRNATKGQRIRVIHNGSVIRTTEVK